MTIRIESSFAFEVKVPTDVLLQFEAAALPEQQLSAVDTRLTKSEYFARVPAQDGIGERMWIRTQGRFEIDYRATVAIDRATPDLASLERILPHELPGSTVQYLFESRYCQADRMHSFVDAEFSGLDGGARIAAFCTWVGEHMSYERGVSTSATTALDTFVERRGICRDYAHVLITLARASGIPARYAACYAPEVKPPDFHAVAEVFLADRDHAGGGAWHIVDATGMSDPAQVVRIGVGRDAADVSFLTSFGNLTLLEKYVHVAKG